MINYYYKCFKIEAPELALTFLRKEEALLNIFDNDVTEPFYVEVRSFDRGFNCRGSNSECLLKTPEDLLKWSTTKDTDSWRAPKQTFHEELIEATIGPKDTDKVDVTSAVNPDHYKGFIKDMEWIESQQYRSRDFFAATKMQVEKYVDRCGKKDKALQELLKAKWYLDFLIAWMIEGEAPIEVKDVRKILDDYLAEGQFK